jgi:hypothetical protein
MSESLAGDRSKWLWFWRILSSFFLDDGAVEHIPAERWQEHTGFFFSIEKSCRAAYVQTVIFRMEKVFKCKLK